MDKVGNIFGFLDSWLGSAPWFAYFLLGTGLFFTIYLRFPQLRFFKHALRIVTGRYDKKDTTGDTSPFRALTTALSGTVGTGNIAGVAYAVHLGGPAALFWMLVTATLGMTTKCVEVSLAVKYREQASDGTMAGGPMYCMKNADFRLFGKKISMKYLAIFFAVGMLIATLGAGNLPQINSISSAVYESTGITHWVTGLVLSALLAAVILGGIKRIAAITSKLVPGMALFYLIGALSVIIMHAENILPSLQAIFSDIFTGSAATGGFMGASIAFAFQKGVGRGLFSNEAGQGSAPIAHAAARADEPFSEGMVAILEPFIDTIVICMITGLTLLASGVWKEKHVTDFQKADIVLLSRLYDENSATDRALISNYLNNRTDNTSEPVLTFSGELTFVEGRMENSLSMLHSRSLAEDVLVSTKKGKDGKPYNGSLKVHKGTITNLGKRAIRGKSLIHSAPLTMVAFQQGMFGDYGKHLITIGLLLFAFSTAISWSYYGDRATIFLFGNRGIPIYRVLFVIAFFIGSFTDTSITWSIAGVAVALITLPNLICLLWLHKDMKRIISDYGTYFKKQYPTDQHPRFD